MRDRRIDDAIKALSNWGRWGPDDEIGTVNLITGEKRREAAGLVRRGETFSLAIPFDQNGPQPYRDRRLNPAHVMLQTGTDLYLGVQPGSIDGWGYADDMVIMALQAATQWDALAHAFFDYKMYNDRDCRLVTVEGAQKNSIDRLGGRVITRGVLLDVARTLGVPHLELGHEITVAEIEATLERERVEVTPGDAVLFRTGNLARATANGGWDAFTHTDEPGVGLAGLAWLREHDVAAAAADTWAFEVIPSGTSIMLPVHAVGIVHVGLLVGEIFNLEALAEDCASDGVHEFLFLAPPLPVSGAVGSPINPVAVK